MVAPTSKTHSTQQIDHHWATRRRLRCHHLDIPFILAHTLRPTRSEPRTHVAATVEAIQPILPLMFVNTAPGRHRIAVYRRRVVTAPCAIQATPMRAIRLRRLKLWGVGRLHLP